MPRAEIRYLHLPAADAAVSSDFYARTFGWEIRRRDDGSVAFDDSLAHVSGEFVLHREPGGDAGVLVYVRVEDVDEALRAIAAAGGAVVLPKTTQGARLAYATFRDPAGNVLGIFEEPGG